MNNFRMVSNGGGIHQGLWEPTGEQESALGRGGMGIDRKNAA